MASLTRSTVDQLDASLRPEERQAALATFEQLSLPSSADESWRYVDLDDDFTELDLPLQPGPELAPDQFAAALSTSARAVVVDGQPTSVDGPYLTGTATVSDLVDPATDKFAAAHHAFLLGGASVAVPSGTATAEPILLEVQAASEGAVSFPHLNVAIGDNAEAELVVLYRSAELQQATVNPQVEITVGTGSRLRLLTVQEFGTGVTAVIHQRVRLERDASFRMGEVGLGGALARLDLGVELAGQGGSSDVVGLFFGHRQQVLDYRMTITHRGRNTTSDVLLKGAVEDKAQSIFAGLVRIEKGAIRSSSFETNRNLVLSPDAKAHSIPNLEILCDDVMCGHGSSVGPLEEEHLYYLQSRGLSDQRAERLLVKGFFRQVIDRLPVHGLEEEVAAVLERRFVASQGAS
ncbi:MAG TPA: Fe-S cluster assembly protein SufD [Acidimicrobiia bacterium]|nr:Fe-S cluster assembly protein SufD [Acidimicrobiia bacterium]